ncbi:WD40 repeat domain-containing protein [Sporobolomyces koalae]|uniref:WD40 repeat domain-containing protein n=1 Tax=Sporobolomyces koalae TaxID=500713 RepID=UPI0031788123
MARVSLVQSLYGHQDRAWSLDWCPSEPLLASCSTDKSIRLYSFVPPQQATATAFQLASTIPTSHSRTVRNLAFSPTGATLATASFDSTVGIWCKINEAGLDDEASPDGTGEWEAVDPLEGHESECKSVAWSADARLLATCSRDKSVWVWEAVGPAEFECLAVLMEHSQDVKCVTWHPSEELLASSSYDDQIHLYAPDPYDDEWTLVHKLSPAHTGTVWSVSFSPCGSYLASTGDDLSLKIWKRIPLAPETGTAGEAKREEGGLMGPWSRSGVRIGHKERFEWKQVVHLENVHDRSVYSLDWQPGGRSDEAGLGRIATCAGDGRIRIWQVTRPTSTDLDAPPTLVPLVTVEDAHGLSDINSIKWCNLSPTKAAQTLRSLEGGEEDEQDASEQGQEEQEDSRWRGCQDWFATAGDDGMIKVWKIEQDDEWAPEVEGTTMQE